MAGAPSGATAVPKRKLGLAMCIALVVGNMVGSGVFLLPADLAPLGWNSVYAWLITIGGTLCLCVALSRVAGTMGDSCGAFSYPSAAFGQGAGFLVAWAYWISVWTANATLAVAAVRNMTIVIPALGSAGVGAAITIGLIWLFTVINCLGVRNAGGVQVITTLLKLLPLGGAILIGAWLAGTGETVITPPDAIPVTAAAINSAATLTLFAMLGFESAMIAGDRVDNPDRLIPRATLWGAAITGLIYLLACSAVGLLLPADQVQASSSPFALFFSTLVDPRLGALVAMFAAIAALGALNGFVLLQGELPLALARCGLLPRWFAQQSRFETPVRAHVLSSGLATALVLATYSRGLAGLFQFMVLVTTSTSIIFYCVGTLSGMKLAREGRIKSSPAYLVIAGAGALYSIWAFYGAGIEATLWSVGMTLAGLPIYLLMRSSRAAAANRDAPPVSAA